MAPFLTVGELPRYASTTKDSKKRDLDDLEGASEDDEENATESEDEERRLGALEKLEKAQQEQEMEKEDKDSELIQVIEAGLSTSVVETEKEFQPRTSIVSNVFKPPRKRGSVLITLRNASPYTLWDISHLATRLTSLLPSIAKSAPSLPKGQAVPTFQEIEKAFSHNGEIKTESYSEDSGNTKNKEDANNYRLWRSFEFDPNEWTGYSHRRTTGWIEGVSTSNNEDILRGAPGEGEASIGSGNTRPSKGGRGECRTWEFGLNLVGDAPVGGTGARRGINPNKRGGKGGGGGKRPKQ